MITLQLENLVPFMGNNSSISIRIIYVGCIPSTTSERLCGGILVAIPTAIPEAPLTKRFGIR